MNSPKNPHFHAPTIYLCLFSSLFVSCASAIECVPAERTALLGIKQAFSSPESDCLLSWTPSSNCCNWFGVTCHARSGHVTEIRLFLCDIHGELPNELFTSIKNLTLLNLNFNPGITGVFPEFPENSSLQTFRLSGASMSGSIPDSIGNLKHLTDFDIASSGVTGALPSSIGSLTKLITLDVSVNRLIGEIPTSIGNLAHLEYLDFHGNNFKGTIPEFIGNFVNLTYMDFSSNNLTGVLPSSIIHLAKLKYMNLENNSLSGHIPIFLFSLPSLIEVYLQDNHLSGQIEEFLNPSTTLELIYLSSNQIGGQIPKSLLQLPALSVLVLTSNNFSGTLDLNLLATLGNLTDIDISYNKIWVQESNYNYIHNFPMLASLRFASCNLTKVPQFLKLQNQISFVDLSNNKISGSIPKWIWTLEHMRTLNLSNNMFMHMETSIIPKYSSISSIDLSFNVIQGPIPLLPLNITYLDYSNNNFSCAIPANFSLYLNYTAFLSFANNSLIGEIPQSIGQSTPFLTILDLSNNYLTGQIPPNIFNCPELVLLKLNGNDLEGVIPSCIKKGCRLKAILVGQNHLNGMIPKSLLNCSELLVLELANNHLSGPYPIWLGNFTNLSVLILKGNRFYGPIEFNENIDSDNQFSKIQVLDVSSNSITGTLPSKLFSGLKAIMNASIVVPLPAIFEETHVGFTNNYEGYHEFDYDYILTVTSKGYSFTLGRILKILYTFVDFSNNFFEGDIPNVISELGGLHILNLSHNALTGKIPSSLGKMVQLELLDLSENQLLGSVPPELASLNFLSFLNLSKNNLSGDIPQRGQLTTFTNSSFNDNPNLCGSPLSKLCVNNSPWAIDDNPNLCGSPLSKLCVNNSPSTINPVSSGPDSSSTYVIGMALSVGLGYGFGITMVILYQTVSWKHRMKKIANRQV